MYRQLSTILCVAAMAAVCAQADDASERFYQAIRNNDLTTLRTLIKTSGVNVKDQRETTPLMYAAAYGSLDAMRALLDAGADANAKNTFDATALLWSANNIEKVRLLVAKGADVNAKSKQGMTPLIVAALQDGGSGVVKFLIEKGADVNARGAGGATALLAAANANDIASIRLLISAGADVKAKDAGGETALMNASSFANIEAIKLLLAKGVDVNSTDNPNPMSVKNGPISLGKFTPLMYAATNGSVEAVQLLLDAGAQVNVQEVRGMTPLMLAIATDHGNARVVHMLVAKGADANIKSKNGETAIDWAKKFGDPAVLKELGVEPKQTTSAASALPVSDSKLTPREAVGKSLPLLQKTTNGFFTEGGCVSCHAQNLTAMAVTAARSNHLPVDEAAAAEQLKTVKLQWAAFEPVLLQRLDPPGAQDTIMYSVLHLAADGVKPDHAIDAMIHNIAGEQHQAGNWSVPLVERPPMEDGDFSRTAICLHSLKLYPLPGRQAEFDDRIRRAATWLKSNTPRTTEDRSMQLLGLKWSGAVGRDLDPQLRALIALQHSDGGWAQTPNLASDAYATGQVLATMHELGVATSDAAYRRGVAFLLKTQLPDGSWHVASRAPKFQPYFQSSFPHDHDQWISASGTAWATMALIYASGEKPVTAQR